MKKILYILSAAMLLSAAACNPWTVEESYDLSKIDKTVTVFPGITVSYEQDISFQIGDLLGDATGEDSFLKALGATDALIGHAGLQEGDLIFKQDGSVKTINPTIASIYDGSLGAKFENPLVLYLLDVPGMLNISNEYTLSNPCLVLQLQSGLPTEALKMDLTLSIAGEALEIKDVPVQAKASQTIYISARGGFAQTADESDFTEAQLSTLCSPIPYEILVQSVVLKGEGTVPAGSTASFALTPSFIIPADFTAPSVFGSALAFSGVKVTPNSDYKVDIMSVKAHFVAENTFPFDIDIKGQPNENVSISVPTVKAGTLAAPQTTEGDILLEYKSYDSISSLIADISATVSGSGSSAQINNKQGLKLTVKSISIPEGVEIELPIGKNEEGE